MALSELAAAYWSGRRPDAVADLAVDAESALYLAVWAHAAGDPGTAVAAASRAARLDPDSEFARLLVEFVGSSGEAEVYDSPAAFRAFIRGGGNVGLYAATSAALAETYRGGSVESVLDIGVGDGSALLPALSGGVARVDLVEPSAALLAETTPALERRGVACEAFAGTVQEFMGEHERRWDLVQSTFALQSVPPQDRAGVLAWIARCTRRFVLVEFDVSDADSPFAARWFRGFLSRVERGLREYDADRDLVGLGFVLPVVLGNFDPARRANHERPIAEWVRGLRAAGFTSVRHRHLHDYWWEPAHFVEATR